MTDTANRPGASELMRGLDLYVDGPVRWGSPVPSRKPGVFIVELPLGLQHAPIDIVALRRWLERVPDLRLDGERPTESLLGHRLADFWLPLEPVLYVGRSAKQIGGRLAAMYATELGDARPHSGGHWLRTLSVLRELRVWWAETDAHEEYEDALLEAVTARNDGALPFASLAGTTGERRPDGLTGSLRADATVQVPAAKSRRQAIPRARAGGAPRPRETAATRARADARAAGNPAAAPTYLSAEGLSELTRELEHLRTTVRPDVIARVKAARELGDLRENADYDYARKEQSFVEGRIQTLEQMIKSSALIDTAPAPSGTAVRLGSTVVVETGGDRLTYALVGPTEADPANGRLSHVSPVGSALIGRHAGDEVTVRLPVGTVVYRLIEVR